MIRLREETFSFHSADRRHQRLGIPMLMSGTSLTMGARPRAMRRHGTIRVWLIIAMICLMMFLEATIWATSLMSSRDLGCGSSREEEEEEEEEEDVDEREWREICCIKTKKRQTDWTPFEMLAQARLIEESSRA